MVVITTILKTNVSLRLCVISFLKFEKYPRKNIVEIRRVVGLGVGEFFPLTRRIWRVVGLGVGEFFLHSPTRRVSIRRVVGLPWIGLKVLVW